MPKKKNTKTKTQLRKEAEARLKKFPEDTSKLSHEDIRKLVHELRVHQVELEMQNEELRTAQEQLEDSRDQYADLFDFAPAGYFILDKNNLILNVNLTGCSMLGKERSQLIKKPFTRYITRDSQDDFFLHKNKVFKSHKSHICEIKLKQNSQDTFDVQLESIATKDEAGKYTRIRIAVTDITEYKKAQIIKRREQRLRQLVQAAAEGILLLDSHGAILMANTSCEGMFGYTEKELIGNKVELLIPDRFIKKHVRHRAKYNKDPRTRPMGTGMDLFGKRKDGSEFPVEVALSSFKFDGSTLFTAFVTDITERRQAEDELRRSAWLLSESQKLARAGSYHMDVPEGKLTWSIGAFELLGRDPSLGEPSVKEYKKWVHPDDLTLVEQTIKQVYEKGEPYSIEYRLITEDGEEKCVHGIGRPDRDNSGKITGYTGVFMDITERKDAEKVIGFQASLVDNAPDAIIGTDLDFRIESWNKAAEHIYGWKEKNVLGKRVRDVIPPQHLPFDRNKAREIFLKDGHWEGEVMQKDKNGREHFILSSVTSIVDEEGNKIGAVAVNRDITQRRKAEKALQESESKFKALFDTMEDGVYIYEYRTGKIVDFNKKGHERLGLTKEELKQKRLKDIVSREYRKAHPALQKQLRKNKPVLFESAHVDKNGNIVPVEVSIILTEINGDELCFTVARDITERKKSEEALRKEKESAQKYLDIAGVIFVLIGSNKKVKLINKRGCDILGYEEKEIIGKDWFKGFLPKKDRKKLREVFEEKLAAGTVGNYSHYENSIITKSGEERIISWSNTIITDDEGHSVAALSSGEDVTEQKQLEKELMHAVVEGQEQERKRLARDLHDSLAMLLSTVKANVGALELSMEDMDKEQQDHLENSKHLLDEAILEIRQMVNALGPRVLEDFGLVKALKNLCEQIDQGTKEEIFCHVFEISEKDRLDPKVETAIYRITQELLNNALKYAKAKQIVVQLIKHQHTVSLTVEDDGIGFDTSYLLQHDGKGIKNIESRTKALDGTFDIESFIGGGTLATIEFPIVDNVPNKD